MVNIYTDGACSGNPGRGGWAAIIEQNATSKVLSGHESLTTNNRMEMTAVISALSNIAVSSDVTIYTDSKYVTDAINNKWLESWISRGWKKADKKPVLNQDLWEQLIEQLNKHRVTFVWIKGHNGHPQNELCDKIAVKESEECL